ncbi:MAG: cytochrome P450 [Gulosibacter sp.]|uniref:cytochrome P450 n=1 Tax=Gulosibacter sp. TaxID=2817531 RepID=UPI003F8F5DD7
MTTTKINPEEVDFFTDAEVAANAEPYFDYMLKHHPVFREPKYGVVIVTGYEECLKVYHQPDVYSSINRTGGPVLDLPFEVTGDDITDLLEQHREYFPTNDQIVTFDPPMHTDHRSLVMGLITPKRLKANETFLKEQADRYLDEILQSNEVEFIWDYAKKYTIVAVGDLLGVPESDFPLLLEIFASGPQGPVLGDLNLQVSHNNSLERMYDYFIEKIKDRRANPLDDVLTGIALAKFPDGSFPEPIEVARIAANMFAAGQETTVQVMSVCFQRIADDQDLQNLLRNEPSLIPAFIEETLRAEAPIKGSFRLVKRPTELGGLELAPGTNVMLLHGAAGRDEKVFDNPAQFDVKRANARQHLAFGRGIHTCPGAPLARAEAVFTIQRFLDRMSEITIDDSKHGPAGDREWDLIQSFKFRGHQHLYLKFKEAKSE